MKIVDNRQLSSASAVASLARGCVLRLMVWVLGALTLGAGPVRGDDSDSSQSDTDLISNGDFSDATISGSWGQGANVSAESWEFGTKAGLTTANGIWTSTVRSSPYAVFMQGETVNSWISQTVSVSVAGRYRLSFWYTGRVGYPLDYRLAVSMDGKSFAGAVTTNDTDWSQCIADVYLGAGSHELKFYGLTQYASLHGDVSIIIDDVSLMFLSPVKSAIWTGEGDAGNSWGDAANWRCYDENGELLEGEAPVSLDAVALAADADWRDVPASSLSLSSLILSGHHLQISGSGTPFSNIAVMSATNHVANGDFFDATISSNSGSWGQGSNVSAESWEFGATAGLTTANNIWTSTVYSEPYAVLFQRELATSWISQTLSVPVDGRYRLSFKYIGRHPQANTLGFKLAVSMDDVCFTSVTTTTYTAWSTSMADIDLKAGSHELKFYGQGQYASQGSDVSIIIDDISLSEVLPSRLTVEVPADTVFDNSCMHLVGDLSFAKAGPGTLVASAKNQPYVGGTRIDDGVLRLSADGGVCPFGMAADSDAIRVAAGATLDVNGNYAMRNYHIALDGGTIANSGADMPTYSGDASALSGQYSVHHVTLTADSGLQAAGNFLVNGNLGQALDLGGHELSATVADGKYLFLGEPVTNGTMRLCSAEATFCAYGSFSGIDADFDLDCMLEILVPFEVRNWTVRRAGAVGKSAADAIVSVGGVFAPVSDYFCNTRLLDGATLDLSGRTSALDVKSLDTENDADYRLSFADNANIKLYFGDRRASGKVVAWAADTKPSNLDTLKFTVSPLNNYRRRLLVEDDGIYAVTPEGLMIILR